MKIEFNHTNNKAILSELLTLFLIICFSVLVSGLFGLMLVFARWYSIGIIVVLFGLANSMTITKGK